MPRIPPQVPDDGSGPAFADPEGLRTLLWRLHAAGPGAWRRDPEAAELMLYTADRYAALARKHHLEPEDAAVAAFEAMLNESTRTADDPWAVVTVAVRITLIAEERANGLLTSTERARRPQYSRFHDAERFSDREADLTEFHPSLHTDHRLEIVDPAEQTHGADARPRVIDDVVRLFELLGWTEDATRPGVGYVCARLTEIGDRTSAYETLRRDKTLRAHLDLPHRSWICLLRVVLGHPAARVANARRGALVRLLIGDTLDDLMTDDDLVHAVIEANPQRLRRGDLGG